VIQHLSNDLAKDSHTTGLLEMVSCCMKDVPFQAGKGGLVQLVHQLLKLCKLL